MSAETQNPIVFDDFFSFGNPETKSPFITEKTRKWGENLFLKTALFSGLLLLISFVLSFYAKLVPVSYVLLTTVYFLAGVHAFVESLDDIFNLEINIDVLMTLAAFSSVLIGSGFEGGLLLVLFALSGAIEIQVTSKAKSSINSLQKLSPATAHLILEDGAHRQRSTKEILVGSSILVKAGEIVPLDGVVIKGASSVNLSHLTGENLPVAKTIGDHVPAGAQNVEGSLTLCVTHTSLDSTVARIIEMVTNAQKAKPKLQTFFDRFSQTYAVCIIGLFVLFTLVLPYSLGIPFLGNEGSLYRALAFLIAASPCALIIALPIAYLSAISVCAKNGILLKGGIILDRLALCKTIAFDKTGTLTTKDLKCIGVESLNESSDKEIAQACQIAFSLERHAVHPIAKAVVLYMEEKGISPVEIDHFKSMPGHGLQGLFFSKHVAIGHPSFISEQTSRDSEKLQKRTKELQKNGELVAVLKVDEKLYIFRFQETIRRKIKQTIQNLAERGLELIMLTGDHEENASSISKDLGIKSYEARLRPEDKLKLVSELSEKGGLAMVGDGINDAPALARATVGICMGGQERTAAMEASDIVLLHDNIEHLDWLVDKASMTQKIVKENLFLAVSAILFASIPALAGVVPLWLAVILHEGGTVLVGLNALRLLKK